MRRVGQREFAKITTHLMKGGDGMSKFMKTALKGIIIGAVCYGVGKIRGVCSAMHQVNEKTPGAADNLRVFKMPFGDGETDGLFVSPKKGD